jgi:hypothetical protein
LDASTRVCEDLEVEAEDNTSIILICGGVLAAMQIGMCVGGSKLLPKKTPTLPNYADPNSK